MKHFLFAILFLLTAITVIAQPAGKPTFEPYPWDTAYACSNGEYKGLSIKNEGAESFQWQEYDYSTKSWKNLVDGQKFSGTNKFNISILVDNPSFEHMLRCILSNSFGDTPGDSIVFKAVLPPPLQHFQRLSRFASTKPSLCSLFYQHPVPPSIYGKKKKAINGWQQATW